MMYVCTYMLVMLMNVFLFLFFVILVMHGYINSTSANVNMYPS